MKRIGLFLIAFALAFSLAAGPSPTSLLSAVTVTGAGSTYVLKGTAGTGEKIAGDNATNLRTFQCYGTTSAGAGAATCVVEVSNDGTNWITLGTITLVLATSASSAGFVSQAPWNYVRGNVTAISGTTATVTLTIGA